MITPGVCGVPRDLEPLLTFLCAVIMLLGPGGVAESASGERSAMAMSESGLW